MVTKLRNLLDRNTLLTVAGAAGIAYFLDTKYDRFSDPALGALFGWTLGHPIIGGATAFLMPSRATIGKWRQPALEAAAHRAAIPTGGIVRGAISPERGRQARKFAGEEGVAGVDPDESGPSWGEQFQEDRSYDPQEKVRLRQLASIHWAEMQYHLNQVRNTNDEETRQIQRILANAAYTSYLNLMVQANALHPRTDVVQPQPKPGA